MKHNKILLIAGASVATIALLAMLTYNFRHTQQFLSRYIDPPYLGYVAATGIELSVLALSVAIGLSKWHGMKTGWFWLVLVLVMAVSILANVTEGYREKYGEELVTATFPSIDPFQGIAALLATGGISITVMAVAEIAGRYTVQLATEGTEKKKEETPKSAKSMEAHDGSSNGRGDLEETVHALLRDHPDWRQVRTTPIHSTAMITSRVQIFLRFDGWRSAWVAAWGDIVASVPRKVYAMAPLEHSSVHLKQTVQFVLRTSPWCPGRKCTSVLRSVSQDNDPFRLFVLTNRSLSG